MPRNPISTERLALFGTLLATFGELHPLCDHWVQGSKTAMRKRLYGGDLVHADGSPAAPDSTRLTMTTSALGRRAVACHVASYTAVQLGATVAVTRAFGYRVTPTALLAGAAINASTHAAIDRGALLLWLAKKTGKTGYIEHCKAARIDDDGKATSELTGPGSAWMELDAALHRAIGVGAAAVTTWLTTRARARAVTRTRLDRVRASIGIAQLALQQIEDDVKAADVDQAELAAMLRELIEDTELPGGLIPALAQLLTNAARRAEQIEPDHDGGASCPLHEAALLTDDAGQRLIWAARALDPQGDPA